MPTVASFLGIAIRMFFKEHPPPHFHAIYQGKKARILIETGELLDGELPPAQRRILKAWTFERQVELMDNWQRARDGDALERIPGPSHAR